MDFRDSSKMSLSTPPSKKACAANLAFFTEVRTPESVSTKASIEEFSSPEDTPTKRAPESPSYEIRKLIYDEVENDKTQSQSTKGSSSYLSWINASFPVILFVILGYTKNLVASIFHWVSGFYYLIISEPFAEVPEALSRNLVQKFVGKVIVVGAGAAGISAAYTLENYGIDYTLLEADTRWGGRVKELQAGKFIDVPIDLGAEWIIVDPKVLQDLLLPWEDTNLTKTTVDDIQLVAYQPKEWYTFKDNKRYNRSWLRYLYKEYKFYDTTWVSYLRDYFLPHIVNNLELNSIVNSIKYSANKDSKDNVIVTTKDGKSYTGTHVIVALPVKILQDRDITFDPPLPKAKQDVIDTVYMAPGIKVWIEFDSKFFPDVQMAGGLLTWFDETLGIPVYFDALFGKPSSRNVLASFQVGGSSKDSASLDNDKILQNTLKELDNIFGNNMATKHYVKGFVQDWSKEPFVRGAYSANFDRTTYDKDTLMEPVSNEDDEKIVYLAGEYCEKGELHIQATVPGAMMSGRRAVNRLIQEAIEANISTE